MTYTAAAIALIFALKATTAHGLNSENAEALRRAIEGAEAHKWHWAARQAERAGDPLVIDVVEWRRLTDGAPDLPLRRYAAFLEVHPDWPRQGRLLTRAEEAIDDATPKDEIRAFFGAHPPRTRQGKLRFAEALDAAERYDEADDWARRAWIDHNFSQREERYILRAFEGALRPEDHEARLKRLLWDRRADEAARMLDFVDGPLEKLAIARIRLQRDDPRVEQGIAAVPRALWGDAGLAYDRLRWRTRKGLRSRAMEILLDPPDDLVEPRLWWRQRSVMLRELIDDGDFDAAYQVASSHRQTEGLPYAEAAWNHGWLALRFADRPEEAFEVFTALWDKVRTPISKSRAAYWAGRSATAVGDDAEAALWYRRAADFQITYYGQLAEKALGAPPEPIDTSRPPITPEAQKRFDAMPLVRITRLLCEADAYADVAAFLSRLGAIASEDRAFLGPLLQLAENCGRPDLMARAAKAASREGAIVTRALFPIPELHALLYPAGGAPDPALLLAVSRQESLFNPRARSSAGALGMMQILPSTARATSERLGLYFSRERLTADPDYNVRLGAAYLERLLDRYDGSAPLALAAYNAGPRRVSRWLKTIGDPRGEDVLASIDWMERIPFAETRNYVQRVLEGHAVYSRRLAEADEHLVDMSRAPGPMTPPPRPQRRPTSS